ncbi:hypothetical protein B7H23_11825 [Notoacmeibacter marinus]|uniref:Haem-binding uptake Tiki superfamily ChaN domain-containing protein n=2 Tax=Notoacmeibacter marinus TaxID=1876515 RepID=A0A231UY83_9HYPH|nr:hypothetical protein B7H23_11825 [Notoacmeibacter marinus]
MRGEAAFEAKKAKLRRRYYVQRNICAVSTVALQQIWPRQPLFRTASFQRSLAGVLLRFISSMFRRMVRNGVVSMKRSVFRSFMGLLGLVSGLVISPVVASDVVKNDSGGGRIVDAAGDPLTFEALLDMAASKTFVLIGEIHPAAAHHAFQAEVIEGLVRRNRRPAIVLEMLPPAAQPELDRWIAGDIAAQALGEALEWSERGWPHFEMYRPIFEAARQYELPMVAAAMERSEIMALGRDGAEAVEPMRRGQLMLDRPLEGPGFDVLRRTIVDSHCGMVEENAAGPMVLIQRARDGAMAQAMMESGPDGAVLIAGTGHVRRDHGVPRLLPSGRTFAIGQFETGAFPADDSAVFDAFHLTEPVDRGDPCEGIRERMKRSSNAAEGSGSK